MSFEKGENVGPYRIIEQLGQGGMATVYKAYHPALDRYVAIKALHPAIMEDPNFLARFEREAKVVAKLEHPNIVPIYDFSDHGGQPYLVMKFIDGETLKARLIRGALAKDEALRVIDAVGSALTYAHDRGYLHRDIKPSNILLSPDGSIYLADFGLARIAEAGASTLSGDMLMGTPHYISPEQAQGDKELSEGTDIYSFGVVLYELVVGRVPFTADTPFSIIHDHIYTPLPLPRVMNPAVPEAVERILLKALAKERDDRFATVKDMVQAFRATVTGGDIGVLESITEPKKAQAVASAGIVEAEITDDTGVAVPVSQPGIGTTPAELEAQTDQKRRSRLFWIVAGVVLTCVVLSLFLGAVNQIPSETEPEGVILPENQPVEVFPGEDDKPEPILAPNPEEHLHRAETLLEDGNAHDAYNEFIRAGDIFLEEENYLAAIESYLRARELAEDPLKPDLRLAGKMTQALFLGAPEEPMWPLIQDLYESYPERDVIGVVAARARLYGDSPEGALEELEPVLERHPENLFARAVLVEVQLTTGDIVAAREVLGSLLEDNRQPTWLRKHLEILKRELFE